LIRRSGWLVFLKSLCELVKDEEFVDVWGGLTDFVVFLRALIICIHSEFGFWLFFSTVFSCVAGFVSSLFFNNSSCLFSDLGLTIGVLELLFVVLIFLLILLLLNSRSVFISWLIFCSTWDFGLVSSVVSSFLIDVVVVFIVWGWFVDWVVGS
jgi:hypothetical protein